MALGFSSVFIQPLHRVSIPTEPASPVGVIAGARDTEPLSVYVSISSPAGDFGGLVQPRTASVVEAIARSLPAGTSPLTYHSTGQGIFLESLLGFRQGGGGHWEVIVNGQTISDLNTYTLMQHDRIIVTWIASPL